MSVLAPLRLAAAECRAAIHPPSSEYLNLVAGYAAGDHAAAITALGTWSKDRLRCDLDNLHAAAVAAKRCRGCEDDRLVFERFSLRAAILLHADREVVEQFAAPVSEQAARCGAGPQAQVIERLIALLVLVDPEARVFLRPFYVAMARHAHWSHCLKEARQWARAGLKRLPKDGVLLLTLGIASETTAFLTLAPAPRTASLGSQALRQFEAQTAMLRGQWETVRSTFEEAVAADPALDEARLRLGRTLWRLHQPEAARACFEAVLARSNETTLQYLAHLFLGRVREDRGEWAEAKNEYHAALSLYPLSEPTSVAVSHAHLRLGDPEGAREVLGRVLERGNRRAEFDPYLNYSMAHTHEGQEILAELRSAVVR